jgi:hypothetical protein
VDLIEPITQDRQLGGIRRTMLTALLAGGLLIVGGAAVVSAADPSASPAPSASQATAGDAGATDDATDGTRDHDCPLDATDDGTTDEGTSS